jgi:hypothetical protein
MTTSTPRVIDARKSIFLRRTNLFPRIYFIFLRETSTGIIVCFNPHSFAQTAEETIRRPF